MFRPQDLAFGPDGDLFVGSKGTDQILRYDGVTGAFKRVFASLSNPGGLAFGTDGDLFVSSSVTDQVRRFDGMTGMDKGVFVSFTGVGDLTFGPRGDLLVSNYSNDRILRFDGVTGAPKGVFAQGGGLSAPGYILFAPAAVPEPSSPVLLGSVALGLLAFRRRRVRRA